MSVKKNPYTSQFVFWGVTFVFIVGAVYMLREMLLPFVLGLAVAYLLNPLVQRITKFGVSRGVAALVILGLFLLVLGGLIAAISPIVYHEFLDLYDDLPVYIEKFWALSTPVTQIIQDHFGTIEARNIGEMFQKNAGSASGVAQIILQKIGSGGQALLDLLSVALFMPVVAYYMMKEWPCISAWVFDLIPRKKKEVVADLLGQIDLKISGFVRGQIMVAFILGAFYAVALSVAGLKYGFLVGLASGFLSIIPMVGSAVGLVMSVALAWVQFDSITFVGIIAGIFIFGQLVEGNILTPKLVGDSVGLHPLWVFFALLAGGSLLGLLGMFLAVPLAASIGVILGFAIRQYKASVYYDPSSSKS